MKFASPRGASSVGLRKVILAEIQLMIDNLEFANYEHYGALVWIRERITKGMKEKSSKR